LLKYTIVHVNDRAKSLMIRNKKILKTFEYIDTIPFFNSATEDPQRTLDEKSIRTDVWAPNDGRKSLPLPGEYGVWISNITIWEHIRSSQVEEMLVLEDDIALNFDASGIVSNSMRDLPTDWDFLSLYSFEGQNSPDESTDIGSSNIHRSTNQHSAMQATIYSKAGATKLLKLVKRLGLEYTVDCFVFEQARRGALNGYSIIPGKQSVLSHEHKKIKSLIDPKNIRMVGI
jgi:GR25 family glycosyltransferase involved in LPS biosynthesis